MDTALIYRAHTWKYIEHQHRTEWALPIFTSARIFLFLFYFLFVAFLSLMFCNIYLKKFFFKNKGKKKLEMHSKNVLWKVQLSSLSFSFHRYDGTLIIIKRWNEFYFRLIDQWDYCCGWNYGIKWWKLDWSRCTLNLMHSSNRPINYEKKI